jgi:hydroxyethylthiazole kinase-like uncharacterized protein yjeF
VRVLNAGQMRAAEERTIKELGIPAVSLMERAGACVVDAIVAEMSHRLGGRVAILCGVGNNGGDGFVVARLLAERHVSLFVAIVGRSDSVKGAARVSLESARAAGVAIAEIPDEAAWALGRGELDGVSLIVDALFGTGLGRPLSGVAAAVVSAINASGAPVVAIDLPSGLSADRADVTGPAVRADLTVALGALKIPHVLPPADDHAGRVIVADIGIPSSVVEAVDGPAVEVMTRAEAARLLPARRADTHKGTYGRVLIVAGSPGKTGAAVLAAEAALRSGAGLVTIATPASVQPVVAAMGREFMTLALPETRSGRLAAAATDLVLEFDADVIACGPGLGTGSEVSRCVEGWLERSRVPLVLDADALNVFQTSTDLLRGRLDTEVAITPHPGEMARLLDSESADIQSLRLDLARAFAVDRQLHVVLKGHRTIVASPNGEAGVNLTGNPGMATAGAGDVLTGMVAGFYGGLRDMQRAARLAVYLHGLAGDLAAKAHTETSLVAGDIVSHIGAAVRSVIGETRPRWGSDL